MKERHPIISALEHQIRIQDEIISKNDFETLKKKLLKTENNSYVLFELNIKN